MSSRVDYFDYLRALAIIPVMLHHFYSPVLPGGGMGVSVFFCLSGFFIASLLLRHSPVYTGNALAFYIRRLMRIYPLYLIVVLVIIFSFYFVKYEIFKNNILPYVGALLAMYGRGPWSGYSVGVLWTVQVEAIFYIFIPFAFLITKNKKLLLLIFSIAFLYTLYFLVARGNYLPKTSIFLFVFCVPQLLVGCGAAVLFQMILRMSNIVAILLLSVSLTGIISIYIYVDVAKVSFVEFKLWGVLSAIFTLLMIISLRSKLIEKVKLPGVAFIGRISYSLYLIHGLLLDFNNHIFHFNRSLWLPEFPKYFIACCIISYATYRYIEKPFIGYGYSLSSIARVRFNPRPIY